MAPRSLQQKLSIFNRARSPLRSVKRDSEAGESCRRLLESDWQRRDWARINAPCLEPELIERQPPKSSAREIQKGAGRISARGEVEWFSKSH